MSGTARAHYRLAHVVLAGVVLEFAPLWSRIGSGS